MRSTDRAYGITIPPPPQSRSRVLPPHVQRSAPSPPPSSPKTLAPASRYRPTRTRIPAALSACTADRR
eukprot:3806275-Rhodomonas_salina.2